MKTCERRVSRIGVRAIAVLAILCALVMASCGPGIILFPLYTKGGTVMDDNLAGKWEQSTGEKDATQNCCWTFTKEGDHYALHVPDFDEHLEVVMYARLVKLGDAMFLDVQGADDLKYTQNTQVGFPIVPVHMFGRVWIEKDAVRIAMLSDDWVKDNGAAAAPPLKVVVREGDVFVTSTTAELQVFAAKYAENKDAFSDKYFLKRQTGN